MTAINASQVWQRPPSALSRKGSSGATAGVMAMLSIFLLLAFFLMLNSLARFETTKTRAVLGSLNATFNIGNPDGQEHEFSSFAGKIDASRRLHTETANLVRTMFGVDRYDLIRVGNVIALDLDVRGLFANETRPTPKLRVFISRLAAGVFPLPTGVSLLTDVTVRRGLAPLENTAAARLDLTARRAGTLVRALERGGFEKEGLTTGIGAGDARRLRIEFRLIDTPFAPLRVGE